MVQCALGSKSKYAPYMDILPEHTVPRIDTWGSIPLRMLGDEYLSKLAMGSRHNIESLWADLRFKSLLESMLDQARRSIADDGDETGNSNSNGNSKLPAEWNVDGVHGNGEGWEQCISLNAFHKYMSISSSRAIVIRNMKHLVPLAGMINYAPREEENDNDNGDSGVSAGIGGRSVHHFDHYHDLHRDGSITVL